MAELDKELIGSFKSLYDLATRIDERVKNLINRADTHDKKIDEILDTQKDIEGRLRVLESKVEETKETENTLSAMGTRLHAVEISKSGQDDRWKTIINFFVQLSLILVAAYILYKLGLQAPATP